MNSQSRSLYILEQPSGLGATRADAPSGPLGSAERPETIRALFAADKCRPNLGLFVVRLCVQGHWRDVLISDEIPCLGTMNPPGGPIFSKARSGELWVALIEKAWAKVFGSYQHTIGGSPGECMVNLTGGRSHVC